MSSLCKTTVYLQRSSYRSLKKIAEREGDTPAAMIRRAVDELVERRGRPLPRSIGAGRSRRGDLGERAEEYLEGFGVDG